MDFSTRKQPMNLEEHLSLADDLCIAYIHLDRAYEMLVQHYLKSSPVISQIKRILPWLMDGAWAKLLSKLDTDYHKLITDDEFKIHGHIYYDFEKRFEELKKEANK